MFFSAELLSKRESGFGLLWLAATLGAKSSFKKLPRRSVLSADISQLCGLIVEPEEPLALRLSSNLMIGVVRVYKVKQEILLTDITVCFNTLKKAVSEMHAIASSGELQMGQPTVRPDTVTIAADPTVALAMDFEHLFQTWDDRGRTTQRVNQDDEEDSDQEFNPNRRGKKKPRAKASSVSVIEETRIDAHTLKENHEFVLSSSFGRSFHDNAPEGLVSSSQFGGFGFDDNFMDVAGDIGDIGDELARELGEGWGAAPALENRASVHPNDGDIEMGEPDKEDFAFNFGEDLAGVDAAEFQGINDPFNMLASGRNSLRRMSVQNDEAFRPEGSVIVPLSPLNPSPGRGEQNAEGEPEMQKQSRRGKRVRLLLDARTELTNEELEKARSNYMAGQSLLRRELERKKAEKESGRLLEEMIWGAPRGINAPALVDFWLENFRLQVEARSGKLCAEMHGQPPSKRRRVDETGAWEDGIDGDQELAKQQDAMRGLTPGLNFGNGLDDQYVAENGAGAGDDFNLEAESRLRSSEEPGQGRRASRPPSLHGSNIDFGLEPALDVNMSSQKSNLFPWDNAGASSSVSGIAFGIGGSDRASIGRAASHRRASSLNRESPLPLGITDSPASFGLRGFQLEADPGFEFELPGEDAVADESQRSDASVLTLERNSFNFLEYAKMQLQAFPSATSSVRFEDIVPKETSTRHVAAAAFYHCLVLTTKNLLGVEQESPYGNINIIMR